MSYIDMWSLIRDSRNYKDLDQAEKDKILKKVFDPVAMSSYNFFYLASTLAPQLESNNLIKLVKKIFDNPSIKYYKSGYIMDVLLQSIKRPELTEDVKALVKKKSEKSLQKILLWLESPSEKEEELGLRSLSSSKYIPDFIFSREFKPRKSVVEKLPPVMRLNVMEALTNNFNVGYNILENFKDADEFKKLLFGSVLRHRERVENVIKRYKELAELGKPQTFDVKIVCDVCGDIDITVTTGKIKNDERLSQTQLGRLLAHHWCPVCRGYGVKTSINWR